MDPESGNANGRKNLKKTQNKELSRLRRFTRRVNGAGVPIHSFFAPSCVLCGLTAVSTS
jgi:hypothetical protein